MGSNHEVSQHNINQPKKSHHFVLVFSALILGLVGGFALDRFVLRPGFVDRVLLDEQVEISTDLQKKITDREEDLNDYASGQRMFEDSQRRAEILEIHTHLEVFYNDNGHYPAAQAIDSSSKLQAALPGLSVDAGFDPEDRFLNADMADYSYQPSNCNPSGECQAYQLQSSFDVSDGVLSRTNLNGDSGS